MTRSQAIDLLVEVAQAVLNGEPPEASESAISTAIDTVRETDI